MKKLHQLPNGTWLDLSTVSGIVPLPNSKCSITGTYRARVVIHWGSGQCEILLANDDEHAVQMATELGVLVNADRIAVPVTTGGLGL